MNDDHADPIPNSSEAADSRDWMAGLDTLANGPTRPFWEPIRRWRLPITVVLLLAVLELTWIRLGPVPAVLTVAGLLILNVTGRWLVHGVKYRRGPLIALVGGLGIGSLAWPWLGPGAAVAAAALGWAALRVRVWRLKIRHLMVLLVLFALVLRLSQVLGDSVLPLAILLGPPLILALGYLLWSRRPAIERDGLIDVLAIASRAKLPLGPSVGAFAALCSHTTRTGLDALARRLDSGVPLAQALRENPGLLPREALTLARLAVPGGSLAAVLEQAEAVTESRRRDPITTGGIVGYPLTILAAVLVGIVFMDLAIKPKLATVFTDFGIAHSFNILSPLRHLAEQHGVELGAVPILDWLLGGLGVLMVFVVLAAVFRYQGYRVPLPWLWLREQRELAAVQRGLSIGLDAGQPLPSVLAALRTASPTPWIRRLLSLASQKIQNGQPWTVALRQSRLLSPAEAALMDAADRVGNPGWALRELAAGRERRAAFRLRVAATLLRTVALLAVGLLVLLFSVAYFRPLVIMIEQLAENWE